MAPPGELTYLLLFALVLLSCDAFSTSILNTRKAHIVVSLQRLPNINSCKVPGNFRLAASACKTAAVAVVTKTSSKALTSLAAITSIFSPTIIGGLLSGSLHAVTGPDHLAALLPPSVGQPGWYGMKLGATWGLGHGCSAMLLGIIAYAVKGSFHIFPEKLKFLLKLGHFTEAAVGVSLMLIGAIGIKENIEEGKEKKEKESSSNNSEELDSEDAPIGAVRMRSSKALFLNGLLHGVSWDGAPSLAPALAMTTWRSALGFLLSYCFGTMAAMSLTAGVFGEVSTRLGKVANNPDLPRNLSFGSSVVAIVIGIYWVAQAFILK